MFAADQLSVRSATGKRVELAWTGSSPAWTVERRSGAGQFEKLATPSAASYADESIAPYASYRYRVRDQAGVVSNEVVVGPPPGGINLAARLPNAANSNNFAGYTALAFDENGDPAVAFLWMDPNSDGDYTDSTLNFVRWDRARYAWKTPVKVGVAGGIAYQNLAPVSLACDGATGMFVVSYPANEVAGVQVAVSHDGGGTWKSSAIGADLEGGVKSTALMALNGRWLLAVVAELGGRLYSGPIDAAAADWKAQPIPAPDKTKLMANSNVVLTLDMNGKPLVAFWAQPEEGENFRIIGWSPESGQTATFLETNGRTADTPAVQVARGPGRMHLILSCPLSEKDSDFAIWYSTSPGGAWSKPVKLPVDGPRSTNIPMALAVNSKGRIAAVFSSNSGSDDAACGYPVLSTSTDGVKWNTCGLGKRYGERFEPQPSTLNAGYGPDDRLNIVWHQDGESKFGQGVLLWREP